MRHLITALIFIGAGAFYVIGFGAGVVAAVIVAVSLEIWFWTRLLRFRRPRSR